MKTAYKVAADASGEPVIVVLGILKNAITNESRKNIIFEWTAKYRTDKAKVINIYYPQTKNKLKKAYSIHCTLNPITYEIGKDISVPNFDRNLENVCSTGIHYYKSIRPLNSYFYNGINKDKFVQYYDNGQPYREVEVLMNQKDGATRKWYYEGRLYKLSYYRAGKKHGIQMVWWPNGRVRWQISYKAGKPEGLYREWNDEGELVEQCDAADLRKKK